MSISERPVRVGIYGCGRFANRTHIPNLVKIDGATIVALSDSDPEALRATATAFGIERTYQDAHEMLASEPMDAIYSVVPAFVRTDVEARAAELGIHLFSEKPQALEMSVARRIDEAVGRAGVISTVGFRERYRPIFQEARRLLAGKEVTHVRFQLIGDLPQSQNRKSWFMDLEKSGGWALDWGVHATDYTRFMTGLNVVRAQAFYHHPSDYPLPLSCSFNYQLTGGASMTMTFLATTPVRPPSEPWFTIFYAGGYLAIHGYERIEVNGETVYQAEAFDPWFEQDRTFIQAVARHSANDLLSDYHDGLYSLAPVLAGWDSARRQGACVDVESFMQS